SSSELAFHRVKSCVQDSLGQSCDSPHIPPRTRRGKANLTLGFQNRRSVKHHLITSPGRGIRRTNDGRQTHVQKALSFLVQEKQQAEARYVNKIGGCCRRAYDVA